MISIQNIASFQNCLNSLHEFFFQDSVKDELMEIIEDICSDMPLISDEPEIQWIEYIKDNKIIPSKGIGTLDYYLEKNPQLSSEEHYLITALKNNVTAIFEVIDKTKNSFKLYSLFNEKTYNVLITGKMLDYKNIFKNMFVYATIINIENNYYLMDIISSLPTNQQSAALVTAHMFLVKDNYKIYQDNEEKLAEINYFINKIYAKFNEIFHTNLIVTTEESSNELITLFLQYVKTDEPALIEKINDFITPPAKLGFYGDEDDDDEYDDEGDHYICGDHCGCDECADDEDKCDDNLEFTDNLSNSDNDNNEDDACADVCIYVDPDSGLYEIKYFETFREIFRNTDYKSITGYKECIKYTFERSVLPPALILNLYQETSDKEKFLNIIKEALEIVEPLNLEDILKIYWKEYFTTKVISTRIFPLFSKTSLDATLALMSLLEKQLREEAFDTLAVGRNDPCPCGSGKKYKKCCLS